VVPAERTHPDGRGPWTNGTRIQRRRRRTSKTTQKLKALSDHIEVLPGAFSGSVCGRSLSGKPMSTIGFERRFNKAFQIDDEEEFVRHMLANIPAPPPDAASIRAINLGLQEG
jgi:hydroxyacylglutathione hydrolase